MLRLTAAMFCSGLTAALCLLSWQRMLGPFTGADPLSATLAGLPFLVLFGLSGVLAGRVADRLSPEAATRGVAISAAILAVFAFFSKLLIYDVLGLGFAAVLGSQAGVALAGLVALGPPAVLLGVMLPLAGRAAVTTLDLVADRAGWLLALIAFGAALGALLCGWVLFGLFGFPAGVAPAVPLQILAALLALSLSAKRRYWSRKRRDARIRARLARQGLPPNAAAPPKPPPPGAGAGSLPYWCGLTGLSVFLVVMTGIAAGRLLGQLGGYHAYLAPTMLGVFLLALALGVVTGTRRLDGFRADPRPLVLAGQATALVLPLLLLLGLWWSLPFDPMTMLLPDRSRLRGEALDLVLLLAVLVAAPPGYLIGKTLPLAQRAIHVDPRGVGARLGWMQGAASLGIAAGAVAGLLALPLLGTANTLRLLAVVGLMLSLEWLRRSAAAGGIGRAPRPAAAALGALAVALLLAGNAGFWARVHGVSPGTEYLVAEDRKGVAFWRDDTLRREGDTVPGPLFVAGSAQGALPFRLEDVGLGAIGPLLHRAPRRVLVLGAGSGAAAWAAAAVPGVQEVRVVEPSAAVLEVLRAHAALRPDSRLAALLANPRVRFETGDARRVLERTPPGSFEVIIAEGPSPGMAKSGLTYSARFADLLRSRLSPGGIVAMAPRSWSTVETLAAGFPFAVMFRPADAMIASAEPLPSPRGRLILRLRDRGIAAALAGGDADTLLRFGRLMLGETLVWVPSTPRTATPLTDMLPADEFFVHNALRPVAGNEMPEDVRADRGTR